MTRVYVSVVGMQALKTRIDHSEMTWGFPSPTAWAGLANVVGREVIGQDWSVSCVPIIHDQIQRHSKSSPERHAKSGKFAAQEAKSREDAFMDFSMILSFPALPELLDGDRIQTVLSKARIAGSPIFFRDEFPHPVRTTTRDGSNPTFSYAVKRVLRRSGLGFMILPRSGQENLFFRYPDEIMSLLGEMRRSWYDNRKTLHPAMIGYSLISEPVSVQGGRDTLPHAFAEPVTGLVELRLNTFDTDEIGHNESEGFGFIREGRDVFVNKVYHQA